ncbi:hypothetical protein JCM17961_07440 [Endothiovibrio diazotrophicus]
MAMVREPGVPGAASDASQSQGKPLPPGEWTVPLSETGSLWNALVTLENTAYVLSNGTVSAVSLQTRTVVGTFTPTVAAGMPATVNAGASLQALPNGSALIYAVALPANPYNSEATITVFSLDSATMKANWQVALWSIPTITYQDAYSVAMVPLVCRDEVIYVGAPQSVTLLDPATGSVLSQGGSLASGPKVQPYTAMALAPNGEALCLVSQDSVQVFPCVSSGGTPALESPDSFTLTPVTPPSTNAPFSCCPSVVAGVNGFYVGYASQLTLVASMPQIRFKRFHWNKRRNCWSPKWSQPLLRPAGQPGRPIQLALSRNGSTLYGYSVGTAYGFDPIQGKLSWSVGVPSDAYGAAPYAAPDGCCIAAALGPTCQLTYIPDAHSETAIRTSVASYNSTLGLPALAWAGNGDATLLVAGGTGLFGLPAAAVRTLPFSPPRISGAPPPSWAPTVATTPPGPWMSKMAGLIGSIPLCQLSIPGTHDSGTFMITSSSATGLDADDGPGTTAANRAKSVVAPWAKAQGQDFCGQLSSGIRYLDLRLQRDDYGGYQLTHTLVSTSLETLFSQVEGFYSTPGYANEILILDFQHFYGFCEKVIYELAAKIRDRDLLSAQGKKDLDEELKKRDLNEQKIQEMIATGRARMEALVETIALRLGGLQIPEAPIGEPIPAISGPPPGTTGHLINASAGLGVTPNAIWNTTGRLIVLWGDDDNTDYSRHPYLWPRHSMLTSMWPNTSNMDVLYDRLNTEVHTSHDTFWVVQGLFTPDGGDIAKDIADSAATYVAIGGWLIPGIGPLVGGVTSIYKIYEYAKGDHPYSSLEDMAKDVNPKVDEWLLGPWRGLGINIVIVDWSNITRFAQTVIALNQRFGSYSGTGS